MTRARSLMKSQKIECGAKTRAGGNCKAPAHKNGKCRLHGGSTPKGSQNALVHGLYSQFLSDEENVVASDIKLGNVDEELRLTKIRLQRALKREDDYGDTFELDTRTEREGGGPQVARLEQTYKVRDYSSLIDRLIGRIESLEKTRQSLLADKPPGADDDLTREDTFLSPDEPVPENPIL